LTQANIMTCLEFPKLQLLIKLRKLSGLKP
jgi:hypothetical protein